MQVEEAIEILRKDILIDDCFINHELDVIFKESTKIAIETVLNELEKKDKVIDEIEDLCIRKSDEEGQEYGGVIIWNFANKIMDIIKKAQK